MGFEYSIVRSARKTLSVCVTRTNEVIVHAPYSMSQDVIDAFLNEKRGWIENKIRQNASDLLKNDDIRSYASILISGEKRPLQLGDRNSIEEDGVHLIAPVCAESVFEKNLGDEFIRKFCVIAAAYGFSFTSVRIRSYKSRWGCCDGHGNITFNYRLLMLSADIQRYVIVHELCHTVHMDHSREFWNLVSVIVPDYKNIRSELRSYDYLTELYW